MLEVMKSGLIPSHNVAGVNPNVHAVAERMLYVELGIERTARGLSILTRPVFENT